VTAHVRMGELHVSSSPGNEIAAIGLGSCIGLAIVDRHAGVAGMAHIVLPQSAGSAGPLAKFADTAVPELLAQLQRAGAQRGRCEVALAGGARMFAMSTGLAIGDRNQEAVRAALARERLAVHAAATGGERGRTLRVIVGDWAVTVQEPGGDRVALLGTKSRPPR
jgi:chemotaxis protein CheD